MPTLDDMKRMADKQAQPLLTTLKADPKNAALLNKTALTYKAAHQFKEAIVYFQKALEIDPKNVGIRDDMASCMYYTGDVDGALDQLNKSLTYDPKHPGTLLNIGIIKWQGKNDVQGRCGLVANVTQAKPQLPTEGSDRTPDRAGTAATNDDAPSEPTEGIAKHQARSRRGLPTRR